MEKKSNAVQDFFAFKIMIFPQIIKALYVLGTIALVAFGIFIWQEWNMPEKDRFIVVIGIIILGPCVLHLLLEMIMLPFAKLELLKEIRDKLEKKDE